MSVFFDGTEDEYRTSFVDDLWDGEYECHPFYSEAKGFTYLILKIAREYDDDDIVYFCEDDYLHDRNWVPILREGFSIPNVDIVTLYDHKDKYDLNMYPDLKSQVFVTESCHWRTVPSTCHTFGVKVKCIKELCSIWLKYSPETGTSTDHEKFVELQQNGARLISSMPGYATHVQPPWLSPITDWKGVHSISDVNCTESA